MVVDSTDRERLPVIKDELFKLLSHEVEFLGSFVELIKIIIDY